MRNTKWNVLILASALALTFLGVQAAPAEGLAKRDQPQQATNNEKAQNAEVYRVHYKINEMENGKTINSRSYSLMAKTGQTARSRVGSLVPYSIDGKKLAYENVFMNIDSTIRKQDSNLLVQTRLEMRVFAGQKPPTSPSITPPVTRQLSLQDVTSAVQGEPAFVGSIDDVASNHRYVIEVTVTRAK